MLVLFRFRALYAEECAGHEVTIGVAKLFQAMHVRVSQRMFGHEDLESYINRHL